MTPAQARVFWISTLLLAITGFAYFYMKDFMISEDPFSVLNHPLQPWMLKGHILIAPIFLMIVGAVLTTHVYPKNSIKSQNGRRSGLFNILLITLAVFSGYLLQVSSLDIFRKIWTWTHIASSTLFLLMILGHFAATYRHRKKYLA